MKDYTVNMNTLYNITISQE